jgi:hypothetical protein
MRKQESRRVSPELLERMRSLQAGFSQAKRAAELKIIAHFGSRREECRNNGSKVFAVSSRGLLRRKSLLF